MKPVLTLIEELSAALDRENIRYCHWKSNEGIERSLSGDTDLDLLIDPEHRSQFSRLLFRLGFKGASNRKDARFPGLFHFYGYDKESKKFVDVHVHYRLIVGCDLIKNYELPFVRPYLDSVRDCHGLKVPPSWPPATARSASGRRCARSTGAPPSSAAGCTRPC